MIFSFLNKNSKFDLLNFKYFKHILKIILNLLNNKVKK